MNKHWFDNKINEHRSIDVPYIENSFIINLAD
jgi:hypothetical protein